MTELAPHWQGHVHLILGRVTGYDPYKYGPVLNALYAGYQPRFPQTTLATFAKSMKIKPKESDIYVKAYVDGEYYGLTRLWVPKGATVEDVARKFFAPSGTKYEIKVTPDGMVIDVRSNGRSVVASPVPKPAPEPTVADLGAKATLAPRKEAGSSEYIGAQMCADAVPTNCNRSPGNVVVGTAKNGIDIPDMRVAAAAKAEWRVGECADIGSPGYPGTLCQQQQTTVGAPGAVRLGHVEQLLDDVAMPGAVQLGHLTVDEDVSSSSSSDGEDADKKKKKKKKHASHQRSKKEEEEKGAKKKTEPSNPKKRKKTKIISETPTLVPISVAPSPAPQLIPISGFAPLQSRLVPPPVYDVISSDMPDLTLISSYVLPALQPIGTRATAIGEQGYCGDEYSDRLLPKEGDSDSLNFSDDIPSLIPMSGQPIKEKEKRTELPPLELISGIKQTRKEEEEEETRLPPLELISGIQQTRKEEEEEAQTPMPRLEKISDVACLLTGSKRNVSPDDEMLASRPLMLASAVNDYSFFLSLIDKAKMGSWFGNSPRFMLAPPDTSYNQIVRLEQEKRTTTIREIVSQLNEQELQRYLLNHIGTLTDPTYLDPRQFVHVVRRTGVDLTATRTAGATTTPTFRITGGATPGELVISGAGKSTSTENRVFLSDRYPRVLIIGLTARLS